jgi:hypothetical protein
MAKGGAASTIGGGGSATYGKGADHGRKRVRANHGNGCCRKSHGRRRRSGADGVAYDGQ